MSMRSVNTLSSAESDAGRLYRRRADRLVRSPGMRSSRGRLAARNDGSARGYYGAVVSLAALRARFPFIMRDEWPLQRKAVPVAPHGAPGPILQDRNMALTWPIGAPG